MRAALLICLVSLPLVFTQAAQTSLPTLTRDGGPIAGNPDLADLTTPKQQPVLPLAGTDATGTVKGTVRYQADPAKPWRLSRYYIKNIERGWLAESVVALTGSGLTAPSTAPSTLTVDQSNFMFVPETVALRAGDSVQFTNSDDSLHNVMTNDGEAPFNINMGKGDEYTHRFATAGGLAKPVRLGCVFHGGMRGWIFVFDHPFFRTTGSDGQFELARVPPGDYTLKVVHPAGRLVAEQPVTVRPGQTNSVDLVVSPK